MKTVTIPVAPLSRCIILSRYGGVPVRPAHHDILRKHLRYAGRARHRLELKQWLLTSTLDFLLDADTAKILARRPMATGLYLYELHKERLFEYVHAQTDAGQEAKGAILAFYQRYGIEEDDYAVETAARLYRREKKEISKIRYANSGQTVRSLRTSNMPILLTAKQANLVQQRVMRMVDYQGIHLDRDLRMAVETYIQYHYTDRSLRELAGETGRRNESIGRSVKRCRAYLATNPDLAGFIAYVVSTTTPKPTPTSS